MIKWVCIGVLAGFLFVAGCNHGVNKSEQKIEQLEQDKTILQNANASWADAAEERNRQVDSNLKESERVQKEAVKGADRLAKDRKDTTRSIDRNQIKLDTALRDPKCNELLEMTVCSTVPLP
jgi:hypothetical protein